MMRMLMSRGRRLGSLAASVLGVMVYDAPVAKACSTAAPPPALVGYPSDGAVGVPTDVRPIYDIFAAYYALSLPAEVGASVAEGNPVSSFELVDDSGVVTPLVRGAGGGAWYEELVPPAELAPRTRYTVRTLPEWSVGDGLALSFTTGDGPYSTIPEPPIASIEHYTLESDTPTSCSPWPNGTCISFAEPAPGVYVEEQGFTSDNPYRSSAAYLSRASRFTNIAGIEQGTPFDCIELRTRAPNGAFSEPLALCRGDGQMHAIRGSETSPVRTRG